MSRLFYISYYFSNIEALGSSDTKFSWRRGQDSNLRGLAPTRFPSVRLKPLGHLSVFYNIELINELTTKRNGV